MKSLSIVAMPEHCGVLRLGAHLQFQDSMAGDFAAPGGARSDGTPKIINPLVTHNTIQFQKSKLTENVVACNSTLPSTFYVSWRCGWLEKSEL
jgi:hypothetical protein